MLDTGLLLSGVAVWAAVVVFARWLPLAGMERGELLDRLGFPAFAGLIVARVASLAIDDPASIGSLRTLAVLRGGVEFWPGVVAFAIVAGVGARRRHRPVVFELSILSPFALVAYGAYEVACLVRDGCYGPASPLGLVPDGLHTRMFPVGVAVGLAVAGAGFALSRLWSASAPAKLAGAALAVGVARFLASFWLPFLGEGPPRTQLESAAVLAVSAVVLGVVVRPRPRATSI